VYDVVDGVATLRLNRPDYFRLKNAVWRQSLWRHSASTTCWA
jgi:hypothetical protein